MEVSMMDAGGGDGASQSHFEFTALDPDSGSAKEHKKYRRDGKRYRSKRVRELHNDLHRFVDSVCERLNEKRFFVVGIVVELLGMKTVSDLVKEVDEIEKSGGQMTQDGSRKRTPGGVFLNLLKTRVDPELYKTIESTSRKQAVEFAKRRKGMEQDVNAGRRKRRKVCDEDRLPRNDADQIEEGEIEAGEIRDLDAARDDNEHLPSRPVPQERQTVSYGDLF